MAEHVEDVRAALKTPAKQRALRGAVPFDCVRLRVERALASGLQGNERAGAERWLDGYRRLDSLIVPSPERES